MTKTFRTGQAALLAMSLTLGALPAFAADALSLRPSKLSPVKDLSGLGMCLHFRYIDTSDKEMARLKAAGVKSVRLGVAWNGSEKTKGVYDWSYYDKKLAPMAAAGLRPILILGFSNELYIQGKGWHIPPRTPEQIEAFASWAAAATAHFAPLNPIMEIWNEADIPEFWNPKPNVEEYIAMAGPACEAMRKAVPEATILAPGIGNVPVVTNFDSQVFMRQMMADKPLMTCIDAVSIHPYRTAEPETILEVLPFLNGMADEVAVKSGAPRRPYVLTEIGYTSYLPKDKPRINDTTKAAYTVRLPVVGIMAGFPLLTLYTWQDTGNNPLDKEHRFGLLDVDGHDKAAIRGLNILHATIGDMKLERRIDTPKDVYVLVFQGKDGSRKMMAWHAKGKALVSFAAEAPVSGMTMQGKPLVFKVKEGRVRVPLSGEPVYWEVGEAALPALTVE